MSVNLSAVASAKFDAEVKHAFQGAGKLRETVRTRTGVIGDTYNFRKMGKGLAAARGTTQSDVTAMGVTHAKVACTLGNYVAPEYTDIFDDVEVNFSERQELAQTIAGALGRKVDQLIIDGFSAGTTIAHGSTNMTLGKITQASRVLSDNGVPESDRVMVVSPQAIEKMMNTTGITSADYNALRVLMTGEINTFMGFQWKMIETRTEGGLTVASNIRDCYAYHKSAMGLAVGIDVSTEVNYVPEKVSWLSLGKVKAGAVAVDTSGIVKVEIDETA
jgi:hypothetical protein